MKDLAKPQWMYLKAALFLLIGLTSSAMIISESANLATAILLALTVWSMCRAYYFAFYVIERYIDPRFRYSGLFSALRHLLGRP